MTDFDKPAELNEYPVVIALPIQWGDQDAFGHVNNVVHIRWFESARIAYMEAFGQQEMIKRTKLGPILASITCHYRRQLTYPDTVLIGARISEIGRSSMKMAHAVYSQTQQALAADGHSTIVMFNYETQRPQRIAVEMRQAIEKLEGKSFD